MDKIKNSILVILLATSVSASADNFSFEIDPVTYVFGGYSAHFRYRFADGWELGLGTYAMTFPGALDGLAISPSPSSTTLKMTSAYGVFLDRYVFEKSEGLFIGLQLAEQNYQITDSNFSGQSMTYNAFLAMPRVGYKYQFSNSGFYLLPWAGVGYLSPSNSNPSLATQVYRINNFLPFATLHLGYSF